MALYLSTMGARVISLDAFLQFTLKMITASSLLWIQKIVFSKLQYYVRVYVVRCNDMIFQIVSGPNR